MRLDLRVDEMRDFLRVHWRRHASVTIRTPVRTDGSAPPTCVTRVSPPRPSTLTTRAHVPNCHRDSLTQQRPIPEAPSPYQATRPTQEAIARRDRRVARPSDGVAATEVQPFRLRASGQYCSSVLKTH